MIENAVFFQFPFPGVIENVVFFQFLFFSVYEILCFSSFLSVSQFPSSSLPVPFPVPFADSLCYFPKCNFFSFKEENIFGFLLKKKLQRTFLGKTQGIREGNWKGNWEGDWKGTGKEKGNWKNTGLHTR